MPFHSSAIFLKSHDPQTFVLLTGMLFPGLGLGLSGLGLEFVALTLALNAVVLA